MKTIKLKHVLLALPFLLFLIPACNTPYLAINFEQRTADHQTIAVLPFEMIYTGQRPDQLTEEDMKTIREAESKAFQISFYNEILRSTKGGKKPIRVDVQPYDKTLHLLAQNNIGIEGSWDQSGEDLAKLLGVDAVARGRIQKHRLMSDLASYGIDLGVHILAVLTDAAIWPWLPYGVTKSKEINTTFSLIDAQEGTLLWSFACDVDADWRSRSNEIIDDINRRSGKRFPYRVK